MFPLLDQFGDANGLYVQVILGTIKINPGFLGMRFYFQEYNIFGWLIAQYKFSQVLEVAFFCIISQVLMIIRVTCTKISINVVGFKMPFYKELLL